MSAAERMAQGYEPRFDIDNAAGQRGERLVVGIIDGITNGRVEVKTDEKALQTGNVYVEHACCYSGTWRDSGIAATEADAWVIVIGEVAVGVSVPVLRSIHAWVRKAKGEAECQRGSHPTKGVLIPIRYLLSLLIRVDQLGNILAANPGDPTVCFHCGRPNEKTKGLDWKLYCQCLF